MLAMPRIFVSGLDSGFWTWLIQSLQWQTLDHFWAFSMPISQAGSHYTASQILSRLLGFSFLQRKHFFALTSSLFTVNFLKRRGNIFNGHSKFYYFSISLYLRTQQVWPSILISLMEMGWGCSASLNGFPIDLSLGDRRNAKTVLSNWDCLIQ